MILYHGTNSDFSQINLGKTKPYKDFGKGLRGMGGIYIQEPESLG